MTQKDNKQKQTKTKSHEIDLISYNNGPIERISASLEIPIGTTIQATKGDFKILKKGLLPGFYDVEPVT